MYSVISNSDIQDGSNLTGAAKAIWSELQRTGPEYRQRRLLRPGCRIAITANRPGQLVHRAFLPLQDCRMMVGFDREIHFVEAGRTAVEPGIGVLGPELQENSAQVIFSQAVDYAQLIPLPVDKYQPGVETRIDPGQHLLAKVAGQYRIQRVGGKLHICVGELPDGSPAVMYRLPLSVVASRNPYLSVDPSELVVDENGRCLLQNMEILEVGYVPAGERLVTCFRSIGVQEALYGDFNRQLKPLVWTVERPYLAASSRMAAIAAVLNTDLDKPVGEQPLLQIAYRMERSAVDLLLTHPSFKATGAALLYNLQAYLQEAKCITSQHTGKIENVAHKENHILVSFDQGRVQLLPPTAANILGIGTNVLSGERLADCPELMEVPIRQLPQVLGGAIRDVLKLFLLSYAEPDSRDSRYIFLSSFLTTIHPEEADRMSIEMKPYLYLTDIRDYYDAELDAFILPAMPTNSKNEVGLGDVTVEFGSVAEACRQRRITKREANNRRKTGKGKKAANR